MSWRKGEIPNRRLWRAVRLKVLDRDNWECVKCGRGGRLEVDHIKPLEVGGDMYGLDNLQTLCRYCHIAKGKAERSIPVPQDVTDWKTFVADRSQGTLI